MRIALYIFITLTTTLLSSSAQAQDDNKEKSLTIVSSYEEDSLKVSDLYLQAVKMLLTEEDKSNAYSIFNEILSISPNHDPSLFHSASINPNREEALEMAEKAVSLAPTNIEYKVLYAELLTDTRDTQKSIAVWKEILKHDHKNVTRHLQMASLYMRSAMPFDAIRTLDTAALVFGKQPEILAYQQNVYQRLKMDTKAVEVGKALISIIPNEAGLHTSIAKSYIALSNDSLAWDHLDKATQLDPKHLDMLLTKSDLYKSRGMVAEYLTTLGTIFAHKELDLDTKINFFKSVIETPEFYGKHLILVENLVNNLRLTYPNNYKTDVFYARHLLNIGEVKKALGVYKLHLNDSTNLEDVYRNVLGLEFHLKESRDSIMKYSTQARALFPKNLDIQLQVSSIYLQQKEYKEAIAIAKESLDIAKTDSVASTIYGFIGDIYHEMGKPSTTYKYYDKALKLNNENIVVLNNYSYFLSEENKDLEKALTMSSLVIASDPDNATYLDTYGWILYRLGRYEEAKNQIRRALALSDRDNEVLLLHLGDIFLALGDKFSAGIYWDRALKEGASEEEVAERKTKL